MILRGKELKMVVAMDTLGTNTGIEESHIKDVIRLCTAICECKDKTERKQVENQALLISDAERIIADDEFIQKTKGEMNTMTESFDQEKAVIAESGFDDETRKLREDLLTDEYAYLRARNLIVELKDFIIEFKNWVVVTQDVMNTVAATCLMFGYTKAELYPRKKNTLNWGKLKLALNERLFEIISETSIVAERTNLSKEQRLRYITALAMPADYDEVKAQSVSPAFAVLFNFIQAAVRYRTADLGCRKHEYMNQKAAAEEAGEAFTRPPLVEIDNDYEEFE